jgi:hypothetical protein
MAVAMATSTLMHAALLLLLGANLEPRAASEQAPQLSLAVVLEMPGTGGDDRRGLPGAEEAPLAADRVDASETAPSREPATASSAEAPREAITVTEPASGPRGRPSPDVFEVSSAPALMAGLSAAALISAPASPAPMLDVAVAKPVLTAPEAPRKVATYSPQQQSMLGQKIDDWVESYDGSYPAEDEVAWSYEGQQYTAHFTAVPGDEMSPDRLIVRVTTGEEGKRLSTTIQMKRLAFSNYVQFVNRWDDSVQIHADELEGRFHTNSELHLSYSRDVAPRFHGKVTTSARSINITEESGYRSRDEIFIGGLVTGVPAISLPQDYVPLPDSLPTGEEQVHWFTEDSRITFHPDGSYSWAPLEAEHSEQHGVIRPPAFYLLASDEAELHVAGTVAGKVLVFSPRRIVITGSLRYATDPEKSGGGDDYLGLVSLRNVEIADPSVTGPGDLQIHGAIYARRLFRVRDYHHRGNATLDIYGSLTAGSLSATEPRYATRVRFDPRLESRRPPGFPVTDRYELESWDGAWTVEP